VSTSALFGAILAFMLMLSPAHALEDEWSAGGGLVLASIPSQENGVMGVGGLAKLRYGLDDAFALGLSVLYSHHFAAAGSEADPDGAGPMEVIVPRLGLSYAIDILELVPWVELDLGCYFAGEQLLEEADWGFGASISLGLEYRRWRSTALGVQLGYHAFFQHLDQYPAYVHFALTASWISDPFDFD
jgi:hypothetical protein